MKEIHVCLIFHRIILFQSVISKITLDSNLSIYKKCILKTFDLTMNSLCHIGRSTKLILYAPTLQKWSKNVKVYIIVYNSLKMNWKWKFLFPYSKGCHSKASTTMEKVICFHIRIRNRLQISHLISNEFKRFTQLLFPLKPSNFRKNKR